MDNNDNKLQQTGGLKLMTVFIAVLALHVIVIGGFTVYHLMSGGTDTDLVSLDKMHKDIKGGDVTPTPDATQSVATTTDAASTTPAVTSAQTTIAAATPTPAVTPAPTPASATETSVANDTVAPPPGPAPVLTPAPTPASTAVAAPAPTPLVTSPGLLTLAPSVPMANNPALASLAPPPDASQSTPDAVAVTPHMSAPMSLTPSGPLAGPVHMPPASAASSPSHVEHAEHAEHVSGETYTVKITDSYKKIAKAHHITVAELKAANHIHDNVLHTGQKLIIPSAKTEIAKSELKTTQPMSLEATPSTSVLSQAPAVRTAVLTSTTTTDVGLVHDRTYTVAKGDTLTKIAHKFKTTPSAIMAENNITDPAKLSIGKKLRIPSKESRSASITPSHARTPIAEPSEVKVEAPAPAPVETIRPTPPVEQTQDTPPAGDLATFQP